MVSINRKFKRPSASMIVACLALVMALTGSAVAASMIGSAGIKDGSIKGKDVAKNTLKSGQISEGSLSKVPKAAQANNAKTADSAATAGSADTATQADDATTVGGQMPGSLKTRWFLLNEQGAIEDQSGGFTVIDAYQTNANAYVDSGSSLVGKGLFASIAIQNQVNVDGLDGDAEPNFAGEVSVTRCQITGVVACAPAGAQNENALVVSPRNSDGTATVAGARKRVYVQITE